MDNSKVLQELNRIVKLVNSDDGVAYATRADIANIVLEILLEIYREDVHEQKIGDRPIEPGSDLGEGERRQGS